MALRARNRSHERVSTRTNNLYMFSAILCLGFIIQIIYKPSYAFQLGTTLLNKQTKTTKTTFVTPRLRHYFLAATLDGPSNNAKEPRKLMDLLSPDPTCDVQQMSGTDLAYIGDVIFEIFIRSRYVWPPKRTSELQTTVVECVRGKHACLFKTGTSYVLITYWSFCKIIFFSISILTIHLNMFVAENQSKLLSDLKKDFPLSTKEQQIVGRGRNAVTRSKGNRRDPATYQDSTAFEALVGYLYIKDKQRCEELLRWIETYLLELEG